MAFPSLFMPPESEADAAGSAESARPEFLRGGGSAAAASHGGRGGGDSSGTPHAFRRALVKLHRRQLDGSLDYRSFLEALRALHEKHNRPGFTRADLETEWSAYQQRRSNGQRWADRLAQPGLFADVRFERPIWKRGSPTPGTHSTT